MKLANNLLLLFVFIIGVCLGGWFGIETIYVEVDGIPEETLFDKITVFGTIIAAAGTTITTLLALFAYMQWNKQQNEIELIQLRKKIINNISTIRSGMGTLLFHYYCFTTRQKNMDQNLNRENYALRANIELYYILSNPHIETGSLKTLSTNKCSDFLDETKAFHRLASDFWDLVQWEFITGANKKMTFKIVDELAIDGGTKAFIQAVTEGTYSTTIEKVMNGISNKAEVAMLKVSRENKAH